MPTDALETLNYVEAAVWGGIGVVLFAFAARPARVPPAAGPQVGAGRQAARGTRAGRAGARRRRAAMAAGTFVLFGVSDVIEVRTGAWWRPRWLLAWKAACILSLAVLLVTYCRTIGKRPENRSDSGESEPPSD